MTPSQLKTVLRKKLRATWAVLSPHELEMNTRIVTARTLQAIDWRNVQTVHIYTPHENLNELLTNEFYIHVRHVNPAIIIETSPASSDALIPTKQYDVIIVPCIGASKNGYRLGNGGGWYDRFLANQKTGVKIGWCIEKCILDDFPSEKHDITMDIVVTDKNLFKVL